MERIEVIDNIDSRIDSYLASKLDISRSKIQKLIKENKILVNDKETNSSYKVMLNDIITVNDELDFSIDIKGEDIPLDVVYENDDLLVINKPSGMVVHPAPGNYTGTLVNALIGRFNLSSDEIRPGIVHRLDKDTSGLMLVAKNDWAHDKLSEMIKERIVKRTYLALVSGVINHETGTIDAPIGRCMDNREKMMVTEINSKEAVTHFKVLKRFHQYTLIECQLETGRTHQIRVHMAYINHPVVNDPVYGKKVSNNSFGQLLHSTKISFPNPRTGEILSFEKEAPEEFYKIMDEITNE